MFRLERSAREAMRKAGVLLIALAAAGCAHRTAQPVDRPVAPPGVVLPSGAREGALANGLLVGRSTEGSCCWVATSATLTFLKPGSARHLALAIYLPKLERRQTPVTIEARIAGTIQRRCCFSSGVNTVRFELPRTLWSRIGPIAVGITSSPASIRNLGFVLMRPVFY